MKKNSIYLLSGLLFLASCGDDSSADSSLVAFSEADNSELPEGSQPAGNKTTTIEYEVVEHDFGDVFYPSDNKFTFKFTNTGSEPLVISDAKASCGCTVPRKPEKPVLPGEVGELDVVFKPKEGQIGQEVTKRITITANTEPNNLTYLDIKANVKSGM